MDLNVQNKQALLKLTMMTKRAASMDSDRERFIRRINQLETQVNELKSLKETYEHKIGAFESTIRNMSEGGTVEEVHSDRSFSSAGDEDDFVEV